MTLEPVLIFKEEHGGCIVIRSRAGTYGNEQYDLPLEEGCHETPHAGPSTSSPFGSKPCWTALSSGRDIRAYHIHGRSRELAWKSLQDALARRGPTMNNVGA